MNESQTSKLKPQNSLASQVSRAVVWNTVFVPLRLLVQLASTLLKLNVLAPASYGLLSLISATNNAIGTWIDLGTGRALPKFIPETLHAGGPQAMRRLVLAVLAVQFALLALVGLGFALLYDAYLGYLRGQISQVPDQNTQATLLAFVGEQGWLIIAVVLVLLLMGIIYDVLMAFLSSFFKQRLWNGVALAAGILPPLLTACAILLGGDVLGVLLAMAAAPTLTVALLVWQTYRLWIDDFGFPIEPERPTPKSAIANRQSPIANRQSPIANRQSPIGNRQSPIANRQSPIANRQSPIANRQSPIQNWLPPGFFRYCSVSFLMTGTDFIASAGFAVFFAQGLVDIAVLMAGVAIVQMALGYLFTPMVGVQVPLFTRVRQGEGGTLLGAYQSIVRLQIVLLLPGAVGLLLLAEPIFALLSPQYVQAAPLVWLLAPALFLECLLTTAHNAMIVYERLRTIVIGRLLTLVCVPLVIVLTPTFGIGGAALAFGVARVLAGLWVTAGGMRLLGLRWPWQFTARVALASVAMATLLLTLRSLIPVAALDAGALGRLAALPAILGVTLLGALAFLGVLRLLGGLDPRDREQITQLKLPGKKWLLRLL
jgi:O-antigen/teichoic acid export membrane protein